MLYFPQDWHPRLRMVVRVTDRRLTEREREFPHADPDRMLRRAVRHAMERLAEVLPGVEWHVPDSWWFRWEAGYMPEEIAAILCGEEPEIVRPNGAKDKYVRRVPTGYAPPKKKYRYLYDPRKVKDTKAMPQVGEKIKVADGDQPGHYEVLKRTPKGMLVVKHDETGHKMVINPIKLYDLGVDANFKEYRTAIIQERERKFRSKDRLPKSRADILAMIIDASKIGDYDLAKADAAYRRWKASGRRKADKPPVWKNKGLDAFQGDTPRYCCLLEAFEAATKDMKTWSELVPVMEQLREVPGFEGARLPNDIYELHGEMENDKSLYEQDMEHAEKRKKVDPRDYGTTVEGDIDENIDGLMGKEKRDDEENDAQEPEGPVDTSFDFGANVDAIDDFLNSGL